MKSFVLIAFALVSTFAHADGMTRLVTGDTAISQAHAQITNVGPICARRTSQVSCMAYGSRVTLSIAIGGCLDNFGGYFHNFRTKGNKGILSFGALTIANKASMTARCVRMPTVEVDVTVPFEGEIVLEEMDYTAATLRQ